MKSLCASNEGPANRSIRCSANLAFLLPRNISSFFLSRSTYTEEREIVRIVGASNDFVVLRYLHDAFDLAQNFEDFVDFLI